jgi:hypothetical protein
MTTEHTSTDQAAQPIGVGSSEGLGPLPEPDMTLPSVAPDSPDGAHFYRASTVRKLLDGERERWRTALGACDAALALCQPCAEPDCRAVQREYIDEARAAAAVLLRA